ncbi:SURF1 family protein [Candidatus Puniceispirillum sp.]|nr:SURF1 family protein [Candidatus Puniceispirillum sp.]
MKFRPFLWLTIVAFPALLVLVGLGSWQLQRLQWKNDLITSFESRAVAAAIAVPAADPGFDEVEFRRLSLNGVFQHEKEVFLTGRTYEGNAGFHVVTPFQLDDERIILINRGWVSEDYRDPEKRAFSQITGNVAVAGILRRPGVKGYFVPENEPDNGFWFTLVPSQINHHLGLGEAAIDQFYADAVRTSDVVTLPIAAKTKLNLRNAHLSYALTWYGIGLALIGVYVAFHYQAGRLQFGRQQKD